ncbi:MAG: 23S rRNA (pseudouridine(1915)-N(3))-methyltransferase RlmH [Acidobacteria bacterium]|nr:23S rRNA (pseudouridine(1915)-N(3))-methyltransferase RlmH [Acidobacteriota bacterium]
MKISVLWPGKTRNRHLKELEDDYLNRVNRFNRVERVVLTESRETNTERRAAAEAAGFLNYLSTGDDPILMDEGGKRMTSRELAKFIEKKLTYGSRNPVFLVGGENGFSRKIREKKFESISLSPMTLTHEWARCLLLEQLYRAFTIIRNIRYQR